MTELCATHAVPDAEPADCDATYPLESPPPSAIMTTTSTIAAPGPLALPETGADTVQAGMLAGTLLLLGVLLLAAKRGRR